MVIEKTPRHCTTFLIGDLNAKIGSKLEGEDGIVGGHGIQGKGTITGKSLFHSVAKRTLQ